jgi:ELWxxDGT repeat protein
MKNFLTKKIVKHSLTLMVSMIFFVLSAGYVFAVAEPNLAKDIYPGPGGSNLNQLTNVNGTLFFTADDGAYGGGLWVSDGTAAGTVLIPEGTGAGLMTNINGMLILGIYDSTHGDELWKSDGTAAGTVLVKDINPGPGGSNIGWVTNVNGTLFFRADDGTHGYELWKSDATQSGTVLVKDISPESSFPELLTNVNGTLFFRVREDMGTTPGLWKSDGTEAGTVLVKEFSTLTLFDLTNVNGTLFFRVDDGVHGVELWKSDGTAAGTVLVKDINPGPDGSHPNSLTNVNGTLFLLCFTGPEGHELWKSDGTAAGTVLVKDIYPGPEHPDSFDTLTNVNGTLFFRADDGVHGGEIWKSDGTAAGTVLVKEIGPTGNWWHSPDHLTNVNGTLFFVVDDGVHGVELWKSDGTAAGTVLVKDINPGPGGSGPDWITNVNGNLFFKANDGIHGDELWGNHRDLFMSTSSDRSDTMPLDSQTVWDNICVFTSPDDEVQRVTFYLDGAFHRVEHYPPYDFDCTENDGSARVTDTTQLSDGLHEIKAEIELTTGGTKEVTAVFTVDNVPSEYDLLMSTSPDRSNPGPLNGQTVSDNIYVFTGPYDDVQRVTFYLDGAFHRVVNYPPYDYEGTEPNGLARATDTTQLSNGEHEIKAVIESTTGGAEGVTAVFTVDNPQYDLWLSTSPNRSDAELLRDQVCLGNIYVFTSPDDEVQRVTFYLDGVEHKVENYPPYDFEGTAGNVANPYDTTQIPDGQHKIEAKIELTTGRTVEIRAFFSVDNVPSEYDLLMSKLPDRSGAVLLDSMTVSGDICVFTSPDYYGGLYNVTFYLDGVIHQEDGGTPFDFDGTENDGSARLTDTTQLSNGEHEITADLDFIGGYEHHLEYWTERIRAVFTVDNDGAPSDYDLLMSTSPNRLDAELLSGQTCSGNIYVFTGPDDEVQRVTFYLDGAFHRVENWPAYDFEATSGNVANPCDTIQLTNGDHEIKAVIELTAGGTETVTAVFTVNN